MKFTWILLLRLLLIMLLTLLLATSVFLLFYTYETFTYTIFAQFGQLDKLEKFRASLLTRERFIIIRLLSICSTAAGFLIVFYLWNRIPAIAFWWSKSVNHIKFLFSRIIHCWKVLPINEKICFGILLLCVIISRLYFLLKFPFHIDERFSYLYFVSKGLGVSLAYYPNPNNHILYTLFCNVARLFLDEPVLIMKVPSFLFGIGLTILFWGVVRYYFDFFTALLANTLFSFSDQGFYYGMQGRGYSLMLIFTLIAIVSIVRIINSQQVRLADYGWFWISTVSGFYTIPIFLYPFCGVLAFASIYLIRQKSMQKLKWLVMCTTLIISSVFLLYLPVFLFNGFTAISGNSWVAPLSWKFFITAYPANLLDLNANLWGEIPFGQWLTLIIVIGSILIVRSKKEKLSVRQWYMLFLTCLSVTIIISFLQRILLYQRVLIFLSIFQYLLLAILIIKVVQLLFYNTQTRFFLIGGISLLIIAVNVYAFYNYTSSEDFDLYKSFDATADLLYRKNADNIFVNYYEYSLCIRFRYETSGKSVNIDTNEPISGSAYEYLVIHESKPIPSYISGQFYTTIYQDAEVTVYERK